MIFNQRFKCGCQILFRFCGMLVAFCANYSLAVKFSGWLFQHLVNYPPTPKAMGWASGFIECALLLTSNFLSTFVMASSSPYIFKPSLRMFLLALILFTMLFISKFSFFFTSTKFIMMISAITFSTMFFTTATYTTDANF